MLAQSTAGSATARAHRDKTGAEWQRVTLVGVVVRRRSFAQASSCIGASVDPSNTCQSRSHASPHPITDEIIFGVP